MLGRPPHEGAGTGAELWRAIVRRLTWAAAVSNGLGALALFLLLGFLIPFAPDEPERQLWLNATVGTAYLAVTLVLGMRWGAKMSAPVEQWLVEERPPTAEERLRALGIPFRFAAIGATFWVLGAILIAAINAPSSGWAALVLAGAIVLGGETTCAVGYLLVERIARPVTELALEGRVPPRKRIPGVQGRLTMAWSLGTGIPLLGILVLAMAGYAEPSKEPELLAAAVGFLAGVGLLVGMFAMNVAARSVAEPLAAVRDGIARIEDGDFDVSVPVDDGSEVVAALNAFFRIVVEEVEVHGGWVNKFEGDAALCVFGAPTRRPDALRHPPRRSPPARAAE